MIESVYSTDWPTQAKTANEAFAALSFEIERLAFNASELSVRAYNVYLSGVFTSSRGDPRYFNPRPRNFGFFDEGKRLTRMCEEARARFMSVCADSSAIAPATQLANQLEAGEFNGEDEFERAKAETLISLRKTIREYYCGGVQRGAHSF